MSTKIVWLDASQKKHFIDASTSESFIIKSQESVESFSLGGGSKWKSETELEWLIIFLLSKRIQTLLAAIASMLSLKSKSFEENSAVWQFFYPSLFTLAW